MTATRPRPRRAEAPNASPADRAEGGPTPAERRIHFLDGLRGFAALQVVFYHLPLITAPQLAIPDWVRPLVLNGASGVTLFFVISAFSLCLTMPGHERTSVPLASFFTKRLFRIAPLIYVVLAYSLAQLHHFGLPPPSTTRLIVNATFVFNLIPAAADSLVFAGWTLGVEMLFYLVFPFLNRALVGAAPRLAALLLSLAAYPAFLGLLQASSLDPAVADRYALLTIFLHLPAFVAGMLVFELRRDDRLPPRSVLLGLAALAFALMASGRIYVVLAPAQWQAIGYALLLLAMPLPRMPAVIGRLVGFVGTISYSVYLWHGPILMQANPLFQHVYKLPLPVTTRFLLAGAVALALVLPLAFGSYLIVERPFIRLGRLLVSAYARACAPSARPGLSAPFRGETGTPPLDR